MSKKPTSRKPSRLAKQRSPLSRQIWLGLGIGLLLIFALAVLLQPKSTTQATALPPEVSVTEAASLRQNGAFILDVREPYEWNEIHIPGATLIPLGELASRLDEIPKDRPIVVVCRSGNRSQQGRDILLSAGFSQVTSMRGGIRAWQAAGLETTSGP